MMDQKDFAALKASGLEAGRSYALGSAVASARNRVARALLGIGATPNRLTLAGFLLTAMAAAFLLPGAGHRAPWEAGKDAATPSSWWPVGSSLFLFIACALDMLDGAVARIGRMSTPFGGVLDSTLDRFSDIAIYLACAVHFAWVGNLTYNLLAIVAMANTFLISYVKARAEDLIDDCSVGWWLRGERCVAMLICTALCHVPTLLWQQATLPAFTVLRRVLYARATLNRSPGWAGLRGPLPGRWRYLAPWRYPRGSKPYDLVVAVNVAFLVVAPWIHPFFYGAGDPLRRLLERLMAP